MMNRRKKKVARRLLVGKKIWVSPGFITHTEYVVDNNNNNDNNNKDIYRRRPQSLKSTFHEGPLNHQFKRNAKKNRAAVSSKKITTRVF